MFVEECAQHSRRVASVCTGSYVLAAAGLLEGRSATTHWSRSADFARRYPGVRLDADRIYTRDGKYWTSGGVSAGIDLALALIEADLGETTARRVAQQLVVYHRRPGGQSQFSALLEMQNPQGRFASLLEYMRAHLTQELDVDSLAARMCLSSRHFSREFQRETGLTPAKAVERLRADAARAALESGKRSVQEVARLTGFEDPERMRRAFARIFGGSPSSLRRAAS
jgi:transcriptional regulator GlxA family with amidase domain